jgi:beta-lactamase regulating signal transducer with metallopeptidase domain
MTALLLLKLTVLLVASLALARLLRQGPAVARHRFWSGVFVALLALPLLTFSLPGVDIPVPSRWMGRASFSSNEPRPQAPATIPTADRQAASHATDPSAATQVSASQQSTSHTFFPSLRIALLAVWAIGTGAALAMLLLSLARVHLLSQDSEEVSDPAWQNAAATIGARLGLTRRVRLLLNSAITTPMAGGVIRPSIYLPDSSPRWSSEQRDSVLAHEIAHLVRQDPLRHVLTRLTLACYTTWEVSALHGRVSSLRGEISSIRGERSSLLGEISSLRGEMSSMHGEISSVRGHESSLRGEISSIRGHLSSLHGAISSENGAISSLHASRYGADAAERNRIAARVAEHDKEIARLEQEIRAYDADARVAAVEKEIAAYAADRKVAEIDARIKAFDLEAKVAAVERRIAALDVDRRIAAIEREIEALDASRRVAQLEDRRRQELKRLEAAITAIR